MLLYSESRLYDIDDVIAQLLALADEVGKDGAKGVVVLMIINGLDVFGFQEIAHLVDVMLYPVGVADVVLVAMTFHDDVHLGESFVTECHHGF